MVFFDVGAHFGYFTLLASRIVGSEGQVHSFEPTPNTFAVLEDNVQGRENVQTRNVAVWSRETTLAFNDYGLEFSAWNSVYDARLDRTMWRKHGQKSHQVQAVSLDEYVRSTGVVPSFVKIDAESAEYEILTGMGKTLTELRPAVSLEVGDENAQGAVNSRDLIQYLLDKGYQALEYRGGKLSTHCLQSQYKYGNILFLPGQV
jgi:FkbM family methyltransferase